MRDFTFFISAVLFLGGAPMSLVSAVSVSDLDLSAVVEQSSDIHLIRINSAEFDGLANFKCRFRYKVTAIESFKGGEIKEFYAGQQAVVGSRYLMIGQRSSACGADASVPTVDSPSSSAVLPVLPYSFDRDDAQSWIALGSADIRFPLEVRVVEGAACYLPTNESSINPCLMPPPAANLLDVRHALRDIVRELESSAQPEARRPLGLGDPR